MFVGVTRTCTSKEQSASQTVAVILFPFEGGIGDDTKVGVRRFGRCEVSDLFGIALNPTEKPVELSYVFDFRGRQVSLQCTDKHTHIEASVGQVGGSPKKGHVEFVQ